MRPDTPAVTQSKLAQEKPTATTSLSRKSPGMTLQRRLITSILIAAPFAWLISLAATFSYVKYEVGEMYDSDMVRMAQLVHALIPELEAHGKTTSSLPPVAPQGDQGLAEVDNLVMAIWTPKGERLRAAPEGERLPRNDDIQGFADILIEQERWRVYYLEGYGPDTWRVGIGQPFEERDELVFMSIWTQILPWFIGLPIILTVLIVAVRRALKPVRDLSRAIEARSPESSATLSMAGVPGELQALVLSMNTLLSRVSLAIEHERRLTADAAHELRTPLAALRSQWEVARRADDPAERVHAQVAMGQGIDRLNRLVSQLLTMARLESATQSGAAEPIEWHAIAEQSVSDCLALAQSKDVDIELSWPPDGIAPFALTGNPHLAGLLLRNLMDNAVLYSPPGSVVGVTFDPDVIVVSDNGPGVPPDQIDRLGDRFFRSPGQTQSGSGLGLSIVLRVAEVHGLHVAFRNRLAADGAVVGFEVSVRRGTGGRDVEPSQAT